jgi:hypothetical protein
VVGGKNWPRPAWKPLKFNGGFSAVNLNYPRLTPDPNRTVTFLRSGHTPRSAFYYFGLYEAAVADLTLSAKSGRRLFFSIAAVDPEWPR